MEKKYQELLAALKSAQKAAREIHEAGGNTARIFRNLAQPIRECEDRWKHVQDVAKRNAPAKPVTPAETKAATEPKKASEAKKVAAGTSAGKAQVT